jgi:hypothetical protein
MEVIALPFEQRLPEQISALKPNKNDKRQN